MIYSGSYRSAAQPRFQAAPFFSQTDVLPFILNVNVLPAWVRVSCAFYAVCCASSLSCADSLRPHGLQPARLLCPWNSSGKNTGVGCHALLQGIFPTQGSNPGLPHCRWILYYLSHQGNPRILEWVAYPFSRLSSRPRNRTGVSCIAGGFFTS